MKKLIYLVFLFFNLFLLPAFANQCDFDKSHDDEFLFLFLCQIDDHDIPSVIDYTLKHPEIKYLVLSYNKITPAGASLLAQQNKIPLNVYLDENNIGDKGAIILAKNTNIKKLSLENTSITSVGIQALAKNNTLELLNVGRNFIDNTGMIALANNTSLKYLLLNGINFDEASKAALFKNKTLLGFDISNTNMTNQDVKLLINRPLLLYFRAENIHLNSASATLLAQHKLLKSVFIKNNEIGDKGAVALGKLHEIIELDVGNNKIGAEGAIGLSKLPENIHLDVSHNPIGDTAMISLTKKSYYTLAANNNNLHDESAFALANNSKTICYLDVRGNHFTPAGISALKNSEFIERLDIDDNQISKFKKDAYIANFVRERGQVFF